MSLRKTGWIQAPQHSQSTNEVCDEGGQPDLKTPYDVGAILSENSEEPS
jgi:hypothetical protein